MTTKIHGSLFSLLRDFINAHKPNSWQNLLDSVDLGHRVYEPHENYPMAEMESILRKASELTGMSPTELKEKFGENLVPSLLALYGKYVDPKWKTFDLLVNTEIVMHKAVRKEENKAYPPILNVSRVHDKLLFIDYYSARKMGSLAVGIINGIARHYNESDKVKVISNTNPDEERVQLRVEFS